MQNNLLPHYITTLPTGKDLYKGESQKRLARVIIDHIKRVDDKENSDASIQRIIGLEGKWGSGKSNVLYRIEHGTDGQEVLGGEYKFFTKVSHTLRSS